MFDKLPVSSKTEKILTKSLEKDEEVLAEIDKGLTLL